MSCLVKTQSFDDETRLTSSDGRWRLIAAQTTCLPSRSCRKDSNNTGHYICRGLGCNSCRKVVTADSRPPSVLDYKFYAWIYFHSPFRVFDIISGGLKSGFFLSMLTAILTCKYMDYAYWLLAIVAL